MSIHDLSVRSLGRALAARDLGAEEVARAFLDRAEALDGRLNSIVTLTPEVALAQARAAQHRLDAGEAGPLTGIPLLHKDIFCTRGVRTTCGSRMLDRFESPYDATVVARLAAAGAVMLGKANMDEFAMGSSCENSYYGPVRNPWDETRVPGGSSGGSAAAVAAGLAPVATGTDTGGSIRQPASMCGITGIKPTYGRVSRYGMVAFASSLDQGGALGRSAEDVALLLAGMAGFDERDSTSVERPVEPYPDLLEGSLEGVRIGIVPAQLGAGLDPEVGAVVRAAVDGLAALGAEVVEVELPASDLAIPAYYVIAPAECSSNLSRYDGVRFGHRSEEARDVVELFTRSRSEGFGAEVKRRILIGTYALSAGYYDAYYLKAQKLRRLVAQDFQRAFAEVDLIAGPVSPFVAFPIGEKMGDPVTMYLCDVYTTAVNLAGLPAMSIPAGFAHGLPVGLHVVGNYFEEARLLQAAHAFQQATDWHRRRPPSFDPT